jgi:hypothetical protein
MISAYEAGDMYQPVIDALGVSRKSAKACVLGVMYGRGAKALAEDEGVPYAEAERILRYHRDTYRAYWAWSDSVLETVKSKGLYELPDGWALRIDDSFKDSHEEQRTTTFQSKVWAVVFSAPRSSQQPKKTYQLSEPIMTRS